MCRTAYFNRKKLKKLHLLRFFNGRRLASDFQLAVDVFQVVLHGSLCDKQLFCNLLTLQPLCGQRKNLKLPCREGNPALNHMPEALYILLAGFKYLFYVCVPRIGTDDVPDHIYDGGCVLGEGQDDMVLSRHVEGFAESGAAHLQTVKKILRRRSENLIVQKAELVAEDGKTLLKFISKHFELDVIL